MSHPLWHQSTLHLINLRVESEVQENQNTCGINKDAGERDEVNLSSACPQWLKRRRPAKKGAGSRRAAPVRVIAGSVTIQVGKKQKSDVET
nr:hypothetical protein BaRGS_007015 [Batillaria attramentaria]